MRNYAVLHIIAEESRIFKTKERCPLLLCIEVYRPTEISLETIPNALTMQRELSEQATTVAAGGSNRAHSALEMGNMPQNISVSNDQQLDPFSKNTLVKDKSQRSATAVSMQPSQ